MFYLVAWAALALVVLVLAGYRLSLSHQESDTLHLAAGEASLIPAQNALAARIKVVSRWGETLTIIVIVYGLVLLAQYGYGLWTSGYRPPQ